MLLFAVCYSDDHGKQHEIGRTCDMYGEIRNISIVVRNM